MCPELTPWREEGRRRILQEAINKAAENATADAAALRDLWNDVEQGHITKDVMMTFRKRLRSILNSDANTLPRKVT
jgi:hypothetical protein